MARKRAKTTAPPDEPKKADPPKNADPLDPKKVHELLGLSGPYEPPPPPVPTKGYVTWWDPGISIRELVRKQPKLFYQPGWLDGEALAKLTDSWRWRQIRLTPIEPDLSFAEQEKRLKSGDAPAHARELATFLVLHFLTTGERLEMGRWRCRDLFPSGRRAFVGPFSEFGLEIGSVSDLWKSPGICLSVMCAPVIRKK